ncbi:MAG: helix-turn-helix transcriptional regulator [Gemmatimonadetes bacterium]|nr:helix-turn-helix transcriptional regulator [Gemmatimonadota bacterium]
MKAIIDPAAVVAEARRRAGLSQRELGERAGIAQPAVARLERAGANPTLRTLEALAAAAGFTLRLVLEPAAPPDAVVERYKRDVDRTLLRENLRRTVDERVRSLGEWQHDMRELQAATRRARSRAKGRR